MYRLSLFITCFMSSIIIYCNEPKKVENTQKIEIDSILKELKKLVDEPATCTNIVRRTEGANLYGKKVISYFQPCKLGILSVFCADDALYDACIIRQGSERPLFESSKSHFDRLAALWQDQNKDNKKQ